MSNAVHIFTGTVEEVFPSRHASNPFASGFLPWHYGNAAYRVAAVNCGNSRLLCYTEQPVQVGDRVQGFSCRSIGQTAVGVLVDSALAPLLTLGLPLEFFVEYTAYRLSLDAAIDRNKNEWYLKYLNEDARQTEATVRHVLGQQPGCAFGTYLAEAHVLSCSPKKELAYCSAMMTANLFGAEGQSFSCQIKRYLDYFVPSRKSLPLLVYPGQEPSPAVHMLPLLPIFGDWMETLTEEHRQLLLRLIRANGFRMLGRTLAMGKFTHGEKDTCYRVILTGNASGENTYFIRALSLTDKSAKNRDAVCRCHETYPIGTILEANVKVNSTGQLHFTDLRLPLTEKAPELPASVPTAEEADAPEDTETDTEGLLTVRENELSLWRVPSSESGSAQTFTVSRNKNFHSSRFQSAVLQQQIDLLHYDVLHWVGYMRYVTGNFIFRLFLGGMLPSDPQALSPQQQRLAENMLAKNTTKTKLLPEGDASYSLEYPVRKDMGPTNKLIHKLQELGLIEAVGFRTTNNSITPSKVLILTQQGANLLQSLRRRNGKFDSFAYLRPARQIKTVLSANQLAIAYLQGLNGHCPIPMDNLQISPCIILRPEGENKDAVVRPGFTLLVRKHPESKGLLLVGESVRNTVGLPKQLDDQNILEKIPRMIRIVHRSAQLNRQHTALTFVFTTYDEMMSYADFIREEQKKLAAEAYFHIYLTYDLLLMGTLDGSHFHFSPETGKVERVPRLTEQLLGYLEE